VSARVSFVPLCFDPVCNILIFLNLSFSMTVDGDAGPLCLCHIHRHRFSQTNKLNNVRALVSLLASVNRLTFHTCHRSSESSSVTAVEV